MKLGTLCKQYLYNICNIIYTSSNESIDIIIVINLLVWHLNRLNLSSQFQHLMTVTADVSRLQEDIVSQDFL